MRWYKDFAARHATLMAFLAAHYTEFAYITIVLFVRGMALFGVAMPYKPRSTLGLTYAYPALTGSLAMLCVIGLCILYWNRWQRVWIARVIAWVYGGVGIVCLGKFDIGTGVIFIWAGRNVWHRYKIPRLSPASEVPQPEGTSRTGGT